MNNIMTETAAGMKVLACHEMPQARFDEFGVRALSDAELIALVLGGGLDASAALHAGMQLVGEAGSLASLAQWQAEDFRRLKGIGSMKARQLVATTEIARRMMQPSGTQVLLNRPALIFDYMHPFTAGLSVEKFWVLCLTRKNRLIKRAEITSGTATSSLAHPREVFREAIRQGSAAIVCVHNHPSGDPAPSAADLQVTRQLREASRTVDIELLDHIIVGSPSADSCGLGYFSFRESGAI